MLETKIYKTKEICNFKIIEIIKHSNKDICLIIEDECTSICKIYSYKDKNILFEYCDSIYEPTEHDYNIIKRLLKEIIKLEKQGYSINILGW